MRTRFLLIALLLLSASAIAAVQLSDWVGALLQLSGVPVPVSNAILSEHELQEINAAAPQEQATRLLERAINGYSGALPEIEQRAAAWVGKITLDEKLNQLTGVAYCSSNLRVRAAAIEISLAGYGLTKSKESVDEQVRQLREDTDQKLYPLWKLGLLGNRGVEIQTARQTLLDHLQDQNPEDRRWAVEALGMLGTDDVIEPLIQVFRTDPSAIIRERAACNLADSGMLSREQRRKAIPHLLAMTDDPALDAQTRGWVYQALREISGEAINPTPAFWRDWWAKRAK